MFLPDTMKAIILEKYGGHEVLHYKEIPTPTIGHGEILVHIQSIGVSPFDCHMRDGWYKESINYRCCF